MSKLYDLPIKDHFLDLNYSQGRSQRVREIVLHHNAGHGVDPFDTWQTREASAHYQVWGDGRIDNLVRLTDTAWHAHEANDYSVGIEHENASGPPDWPIADAGLHASAKLVGYLCAKLDLGVPRYHVNVTTHNAIESDGVGVDSGTACPGPYFLRALGNPTHWYWTEARDAYKRALGGSASIPAPTTEDHMALSDEDVQKIAAAVWAYQIVNPATEKSGSAKSRLIEAQVKAREAAANTAAKPDTAPHPKPTRA
jgi:N-acetylmuramoyl-L-alanine amidase